MDIFSLFSLAGGLAFFLYGMTVLSQSLKTMAGGKLEGMLEKVTDNPLKGFSFGALVTVAIQSSSALTVMLIGFVNSGLMNLGQSIPIIMGSDIGTTLTAWILSLTGVSNSNVFLKLLNPKYFSPLVALVGIIMIMASKKRKNRDIGNFMIGFAIVMTGMTMMGDAVSPLKDMPEFSSILVAFSNPLVGVLAGTIITGIIQSSAASIGMLQALSMTGQITYGIAIPIVMGANIGTCMTAILSCLGVNRNAKRVSVVHVAIKILGTAVILPLFLITNSIFHFSFLEGYVTPVHIALIHTIFNICTTLILFPFRKKLEDLAHFIIKDAPEDKEFLLDPRLLNTPAIALHECRAMTVRMIQAVRASLDTALSLISTFDAEQMAFITTNEERVDSYQDSIGSFLVQLNQKNLSAEHVDDVSRMLQEINEYERIADLAFGIAQVSEKMNDQNLAFSSGAVAQISNLMAALREAYTITIESDINDDPALAAEVKPLKEIIVDLCADLRNSHIDRLTRGLCSAELGFLLNDMLVSTERIAGHSLNIAVIIQRYSSDNRTDFAYMHDLKSKRSAEYTRLYRKFYNKYVPQAETYEEEVSEDRYIRDMS
jgi:phosphate:Na+ symporter